MMIPFSCKTLSKVKELFLEDGKIVLTLNSLSFFTVGSLFDAGGSAHDSADGESRILGKEGAYACFTFEVDALLDAEVLCEVK